MPAHSALTGSELHEPKGADTASAGYVYVSDGAGSGTWQIVSGSAYAGIVSKDSSIAIATIGTTAKVFAGFDTNSPNNHATSNHSGSNITVNLSGNYFISFILSFQTASSGDSGIYQFHLRVNGSEHASLGSRRAMSGTSDIGSVAFSGITALTANDVLTIYIESDNGSDTDDIVVESSSLSVLLLQGT